MCKVCNDTGIVYGPLLANPHNRVPFPCDACSGSGKKVFRNNMFWDEEKEAHFLQAQSHKKVMDRLESMTKEELIQSMVKVGIYDKDGNLTEKYKDDFLPSDESGSSDRFKNRIDIFKANKKPVYKHHWWWVVHNCISHMFIGLVPCKMSFDFHDWTSKKINGK
jgi:hypothetical protein